MPLVIPDETLRAAGLSEVEAKVEIACRWFDAGKLAFGHAAALAGLSEVEFEAELEGHGVPPIPIHGRDAGAGPRDLKKLGRW